MAAIGEIVDDKNVPHADLASVFGSGFPRSVLRSELFRPDWTVWHNTDRQEVPGAASVQAVTRLVEVFPDLRAEDLRCTILRDGFVLRFNYEFTDREEKGVSFPVALFVEVEGGLITRLEEYLNAADAAALGAAFA
jgi:hypothetical protein